MKAAELWSQITNTTTGVRSVSLNKDRQNKTTSFVTISNVNLSPCTPIKIILGISTLLFDHELGNLSQAPNRKLCDTVFDPVIGDGSSILYCSKSSTEEIFQFKLSIMLQYKFNFLKLSKATPLQNRFYMKRM